MKVQLGENGKFLNVKDSCAHPTFYIVTSGVYKYVICRICGKHMGELHDQIVKKDEIQGKGKKSS